MTTRSGNHVPPDACDIGIDELATLFSQVVATPHDQRSKLIGELCEENHSLREQLTAMLDADSSADALLDHSLAPEPPSSLVGEHIAGYRLRRLIGRGGMGVVYEAEQTEPICRQVALKVIVPGFDTSEVLTRFDAERNVLSLMDHPNIAKVLDAGTTDYGLPFFVMELVRGEPITAYCSRKNLRAESRLRLFITVCKAIQHAHQKGIIHRDIKPSNVLVADYDGQVAAKVIDFGVAKAINQSLTHVADTTRCGQIIGTLGYMSPEQSGANQFDVDTRSDVYSLGVLLYELLTGCPPFDLDRLSSVSWEDALRTIREDDPPRPSLRLREQADHLAQNKDAQNLTATLWRRVRGELDWVVMKAIEKDRNRRYASPSDLAKDIECFLGGEAVSACPPTAAYRLRKFAQRNKTAFAASTLVAASLLTGLAGTTWQAIRASRAEKSAAASAAESRAANDFLVHDLLGLAGAESQISAGLRPDPNLKLDTLLERAVLQLDDRFEGQDRIKNDLKATLAHSFESVGRYEDAAAMYSEVVEAYERLWGREHPDTLPLIRQLVRVKLELGELSEAEDLCRHALESSRRMLGDEHRVSLLLLDDLATVYHRHKNFHDAQRTHQDCLEIKKRVYGEAHPEALATKSRIASVYESLERYTDAESLHWEVLEAYRRTVPTSHPAIAAAQHSIGRCRLRRGRHSGDEVDFRNSIPPLQNGYAAFLEVRGADHPNTLESQANLAQAYSEMRRHEDAETLLTDLVERLSRLRGAEHPSTVRAMNHLGCVYIAEGRLAEAECMLTDTRDLLRNVTRDEPIVRQLMNNLAIVYYRMGKLEESIRLDEELLGPIPTDSKEEAVETLATRARLGLCYLDVGRVDEGRAVLTEAFSQAAHLPGSHVIASVLADSFIDEDALQAIAWTEREVDRGRQALPEGSLDLAGLYVECGERLLALGEPSRAEEYLGDSLSIYESVSPASRVLFVVQFKLGESLVAQGKLSAAKPLMTDSCEAILERSGSLRNQADESLIAAVNGLISLLERVESPAEAGRWRAERDRLISVR